ncbi:MAG: membrane protein insertion efficiency factor YidD [Corynebacterium sp.]|uniref:membrane protein insertion efficiency factor YidD n=1 Tax=Corynebacterium sp. TaxID=1720 RepID=UPI0026DAC188|nr:membrane protein insertion efficiency factor YidD [Corynebacterium sp.]MDO4762669.1 membrane protein insertion efficiency factor YidD [Corynebacterium sp.]
MCEQHSPKSGDPKPKHSFLARALIACVTFYQRYISALKPGSTCRFEPTCSAYSLQALNRYGAIRGFFMTLIRLSKCGPWHPGGYDPVPPREPKK